MTQFGLSEIQAQEILNLRLQRLTALERDKILAELAETEAQIRRYREILADEREIDKIIVEELDEMRKLYAEPAADRDPGDGQREFTAEDLIAEEDMVVTISHEGYIKRNPVAAYRAQRRGGRGKIGATTREEDFVEHLFVASTHSYILFFTSIGRVYWLKVHEVPLIGRAARGKPLVNLSESRRRRRRSPPSCRCASIPRGTLPLLRDAARLGEEDGPDGVFESAALGT